MFQRKKETKDRPRKGGDLSQFMPFAIPAVNEFDPTIPPDGDDDDNDSDLEAELLQLTSGNAPPPRKTARTARPAPTVVNPESLDQMVGAILKDNPSDEELSGDDDDPELLNELGNLVEEESTPDDNQPPPPPPPRAPVAVARQAVPSATHGLIHVLEERLNMYREAEKNAKEAGETLRAKRFGRGIKTLLDMLKQAKAGRNINEEEIPPPVVVKMTKKVDPTPAPEPVPALEEPTPEIVPIRRAPPPPVPIKPTIEEEMAPEQNEESVKGDPAAEPSVKSDKDSTIAALAARRDEYKIAALQAKKAGDKETAINYVRIVKKFEIVISAVENGEIVDLNEMPPPPPPLGSVKTAPPVKEKAVEENEKQKDSDNAQASGSTEGENQPESDLYSAPAAPATVMEALVQRLEKYKSVEKAAQEEGNGSKARRIGRIVKQYENAIKLHKAGKPIPVDELPTPPGFAPIPQEGGVSPTPKAPSTPQAAAQDDSNEPASLPKPKNAHLPRPAAVQDDDGDPASLSKPTSLHDIKPSPTRSPNLQENVRKTLPPRLQKQLSTLLLRQKQFKEAALQAKRREEISQAREYLRQAKGFDPLIEATYSGLPVDMQTIPVPPNTNLTIDDSDFDIVEANDCVPNGESDKFSTVERALADQVKTCLELRDQSKATGDVANVNKFEQLAAQSKQDLDAVHNARKRGAPLPKYHYEKRLLSVVECCTDLGENDLELHIIRGMNYQGEMDTYVKFEFPYPNDYPQKDRTATVRNNNWPSYDQKFMLTFQRNSRECQRVFKRKSLKCEVYSKGGFLRSDVLIGTATVKLQPLESKCIYLQNFELRNGRKATGAHLELKIRIRTPLVSKQMENVPIQWVVIDSF